ncbi:alpha/beta hydrolase [Polynucleobacter sp. AP-Elch-400A-B2]|uniref:alpha/beta fold hydrolase n=1 Tax=Polynucleobacter sp. AP-Elch-400A-B2 TaxID=2576930 RepID=UPI001BFE40AA|nr:alpha/beta hydrolase [Polynucleobacter sp. AP-Elch-400A-B2]QWE25495.1 alpha/beta hydrolase [Polynucleobacter sp. AP-Elch-400A-B2]
MKRKLYDSLVDLRLTVSKVLGFTQEIKHITPVTTAEKFGFAHELFHKPSEILELAPKEGSIRPQVLAKSKIALDLAETQYFDIADEGGSRKLAYSISGNMNAEKVLLCLPGLLETKDSFSVLHRYFLRFEECKVVSVDFPGRGDSESIALSQNYTMSLYLSDIQSLIKMLLSNHPSSTQFTILGTSMGGVLAMYLTQSLGKRITEIILNDIALTVNWTALYSLYKSMKNEVGFKEVKQLAKDLRVDERAFADVQLPGHFDLSYKADVWGMNFHEAMEGYKGKVALIYGADSKVCTRERVRSAKAVIPRLITFEVENAGHPVPFTLQVCEFIQQQMKLK